LIDEIHRAIELDIDDRINDFERSVNVGDVATTCVDGALKIINPVIDVKLNGPMYLVYQKCKQTRPPIFGEC
jgi:hypothetical protein